MQLVWIIEYKSTWRIWSQPNDSCLSQYLIYIVHISCLANQIRHLNVQWRLNRSIFKGFIISLIKMLTFYTCCISYVVSPFFLLCLSLRALQEYIPFRNPFYFLFSWKEWKLFIVTILLSEINQATRLKQISFIGERDGGGERKVML